MKYTILDQEIVYDGFFKMLRFKLQHELFRGGESQVFTRESLERGHAVAIFLYDPRRDEVILVEQFRVGAIASDSPWMVELVAGVIEAGEKPEDVARREAEEESGAEVSELEFVTRYYNSPGGSSETTSVYYAEVDAKNIEGHYGLDTENEDIRVIKLSADDFVKNLDDNLYVCGSLIIAGHWFQRRRREKFNE